MNKIYNINSKEYKTVSNAAYIKARAKITPEAFKELSNDVRSNGV